MHVVRFVSAAARHRSALTFIGFFRQGVCEQYSTWFMVAFNILTLTLGRRLLYYNFLTFSSTCFFEIPGEIVVDIVDRDR